MSFIEIKEAIQFYVQFYMVFGKLGRRPSCIFDTLIDCRTCPCYGMSCSCKNNVRPVLLIISQGRQNRLHGHFPPVDVAPRYKSGNLFAVPSVV